MAVFDAQGEPAGWARLGEVRDDLIYHARCIAVPFDPAGRMIVRRSENGIVPLYDVFLDRIAERHDEAVWDRITESAQPLGSRAAEATFATVGASWNTNFAEFRISYIPLGSLPPLLLGYEAIRPDDLLREVAAQRVEASYSLLTGITRWPGIAQETHARAIAALAALESSVGWQQQRPRYQIQPSLNRSFERLIEEVGRYHDDTHWFANLVEIYDNQRQYYPAEEGLEVGDLILSSREIADGIRTMAANLAHYCAGGSLVLIGKLEGGRRLTEELSEQLSRLNVSHSVEWIKTTWVGHGRAIASKSVPIAARSRVVICDTMISSGATFQAIIDVLDGAPLSIGGAVLLDFQRRRQVQLARLDAVLALRTHDWTVGYGSDGLVAGEERARDLPFIVSLKPLNMGNRSRLMHFGRAW